MVKIIFRCLILASLFTMHAAWSYTRWTKLATGIEYTTLYPSEEDKIHQIHAFRIDLNQYQLQMAFAHEFEALAGHAHNFAESKKALIAINGGFFAPNFTPIGLRIQDGMVLNPLKNTSWFGVFVIKNNRAQIMAKSAYAFNKKISFAIQAGPRLIINGVIPKLKEGDSERTALAIDDDGKVLVITTQNLPISLTDFAEILKKEERNDGLGVNNALNLDGGSSSQLYAAIGDFHLNVLSLSSVTDAVVVVPKKLNSRQ